MGVIAEEVVRIKADTGTFKQDVDGASSGVSKLGLVAGAAALGGVALLAKGFMDGMQSAVAHQKVMAQAEAVIKSTGATAGVTAPHVDSLADSIEKMSGIDGDAVIAGENMLLTFTNIKNGVGAGNQIFDDATNILADMSTAMGTDMKSGAIQLGKALNDPIKGVGALSKVGVTFTQGQKDSIKAMVEHGNTAGAQKVILAELGKEFGGSAKAAGTTFAGQVKILQAYLGDLEEFIAMKVLPILQRMVAWAIANWPKFASYATAAIDAIIDIWNNGLAAAFKTGIAIIKGVVTVISDMIGWLKQNKDVAAALGIAIGIMAGAFALWGVYLLAVKAATAAYTAVQWLLNAAMTANPIGLLIVGIALLIGALVLLYLKSETVRDIIDAVFAAMKTAVSTAIAVIVPLVESVADVVSTVVSTVSGFISGNWTSIWGVVSAVVDNAVSVVTGFINGMVDIVSGVIDLVSALISGDWSAAWDALVQIVTGMLQVFNALLMGIPGMILGVIVGAASAALQLGTSILDGIVGTLTGLAASVLGFITGAVSAVTGAVAGAASAAVSFGQGILTGITGALGTLATTVGGFLSATATAITGAVTGVIAVATTFGHGIITGAVAGVTGIAASILTVLNTILTTIATFATGVVDNAKAIGAHIITGVVDGLAGIGGKALAVVDNIATEINAFATNVFARGEHIGQRVVAGVLGGLAGIGGKALDVINNIADVVNQFAQDVWAAAQRIGARIVEGVLSALRSLPGQALGILKSIPGVGLIGGALGIGSAAGGIVSQQMVTMVGEDAPRWPEVIIPMNPAYRDRALDLLSFATSNLGGGTGSADDPTRLGSLSSSGSAGKGASVTIGLNDSALASAVYALVDELRAGRGSGAPVTIVATGGANAAVYSARR